MLTGSDHQASSLHFYLIFHRKETSPSLKILSLTSRVSLEREQKQTKHHSGQETETAERKRELKFRE